MHTTLLVKGPGKAFHGQFDSEIAFHSRRVVETKQSKYFVIQDRSLSYRCHLHQHPLVQPLIRRLLRKGTKGLQAADTEYAPGEESLPYGVDVRLGKNIAPPIAKGARIALFGKLVASDAAGNPVQLTKGTELTLAADAAVQLAGGALATLVAPLKPAPFPLAGFKLPATARVAASVDTPIVISGAAAVTLPTGAAATLPAGSNVMLAGGTEFAVGEETPATVLRRRMRPVKDLYADFFDASYHPDPKMVRRPWPAKDLDFSSGGAYAGYNWEVFFHVPLTIAIHLSKNQRYAEAQRWFHYLFDPTDDGEGPTPERFWKVRPFQSTDVKKIEEILVNLSTGADASLRNETIRSIEAWKDAPFRPHVVARYRQQAFMYKTVMAYLDNLVAWGDSLFRQDTGEAVDEALMLYVLAANILGPRPLPVPKKGAVRPQTYANLRHDLDQFGNVMREMEPDLPYDLLPLPSPDEAGNEQLATLRSLGKALYFCVPRNDSLLRYWDTVADRLFKIHNSLNLQGIFRQMALFEPPIDPAMLARAAAAGLDIGAVVNGVNQPLPLVRFSLLVQKASEIVQEVKLLGNSLLAAMEKEDGEAMSLLRARHERVIMEMVEHVKYGQLQEAVKSRAGLLQSLLLARQRYTFYERQLGRQADEIAKALPVLDDLDQESLAKMQFTQQEPELAGRDIDIDIATDAAASAAQFLNGGKLLSSHEVRETLMMEAAQLSTDVANILNVASSASHYVPEFTINVEPMGAGSSVVYGGRNVGDAVGATAAAAKAIADRLNYEARRAARIDGFARRERDWKYQSNLAAGEMNQIIRQLRAAQIREAIAEQELKSHRRQMAHALEIERFLNEEGTDKNGKKTNKALYAWMKREVKGLYAQCFQFAFDVARKAERALQHELGRPELSYLQYGYLAGKEGLLAGDKLWLDVKRMEMDYHEQNAREYELSKHVSLMQVDPLALVELRMTGSCTVRLPESLFDMDGPGHYFRRIKTVAMTIPCVTGPYAAASCTLTLLKSSIRRSAVAGDQYERVDAEDDRFSDAFGSVESIVTSSAQNDGGLFETNLRDERYLPFENAGVISEWQLQLPANPIRDEPQQFDYDTISDVILHLRYTAREGGGLLRSGALASLNAAIKEAGAPGSVRLFSVRHEFPTEWAAFLGQTPAPGQRRKLALTLRKEHYPFWAGNLLNAVSRVGLLARSTLTPAPASVTVFDKENDAGEAATKDTLVKTANLNDLLVGGFSGGVSGIALPAAPEMELTLYLESKDFSDLWLAVTWHG